MPGDGFPPPLHHSCLPPSLLTTPVLVVFSQRGVSPLHAVAVNGDEACCKLLLDHGAKVYALRCKKVTTR